MASIPLLDNAIGAFEPISITEMDRVKLQVRMDTKYLLHDRGLPAVLQELAPEYRLLHVDGVPGTRYRTLYYDTADLQHYLAHHNGRTFRSKVRYREYVGSDLFFLEVKRKTGRGGTDKARLRVDGIHEELQGPELEFVQRSGGGTDPLLPTLWNNFSRLTLVHRTRAERLTLDRELVFIHDGQGLELTGICIAELKEEKERSGSPFADLMRRNGQRPQSMSKYCTGIVLTGAAPKYNSFKETLRRVERLQGAAA